METQYLKQNIGQQLTEALNALYTYSLNTQKSQSHPHTDPIGFIGRHLLEQDRVFKDILASKKQVAEIDALKKKIEAQDGAYTSARNSVMGDLKRKLEKREFESAEKAIREEVEAKIAEVVKSEEVVTQEAEKVEETPKVDQVEAVETVEAVEAVEEVAPEVQE